MKVKVHNTALDKFYLNLDACIKENIFKDKMVVVFGSSRVAGTIISYLLDKNIEVHCIVDNDKNRQGTTIFNLKVYSPTHFKEEFNTNAIFLIASYWQDEMIEQLEDFGYREENIVKVLDFKKELNDYSFADRSNCVEMSMEEIKREQLQVLKFLDRICKENNIRYYLTYGTLLGAVRHSGYIPWDDDIDILVEIKDLKRLVEILKDNEDYTMISCFNTENYFEEFAMLTSNHTISDINNFPVQMSAGVFVELFPLSGLPSGEKEYEDYIIHIKELEMKRCGKLYSPVECKRASDELMDYIASYDFDECEYAGFLLSPYYLKDRFKKDVFEYGERLLFEGNFLSVPKNYDQYLKQIYGDYMKLPPIEEQYTHHFYKAYWENEIK
ncbi:MAG: LicD family protein [Acetivibrio sp.]